MKEATKQTVKRAAPLAAIPLVIAAAIVVPAILATTPDELRSEADRLGTTQDLLNDAATTIESLQAQVDALEAQVAAKDEEIAALQARIDELESQVPSPTPSPTPTPTPSPSPVACTGFQVPATSNLASVALAQPAGTRFCLSAGVYVITASVVGQQGDVFEGAGRSATFLKGNGTVQHLMSSSGGADFEVRSLDISGAVGDAACQPNCGRAFRVSGVVTLRDIRCHDNENQCAGGGGGGVKMFDSECDHNGFGPAFTADSKTRSGACIKKASNGMEIVEVRRSFIHHNGWAGVWCDFCAPNSVFIVAGNTITDNFSKGVSYEASGGTSSADYGLVQNNIIQRNGLGDTRTVSSGITCNSCADLTIENNIFGGNANNRAVGLVNAGRAAWGDLQNIIIRNNTLNGNTVPCTTVGVTCSGNT